MADGALTGNVYDFANLTAGDAYKLGAADARNGTKLSDPMRVDIAALSDLHRQQYILGLRDWTGEAGYLEATPYRDTPLLTTVASPPDSAPRYNGGQRVALQSFGGGVTLNGFSGVHVPGQGGAALWGRYSNVAGDYIEFSVWLEPGSYILDHWDFLSTHFGKGTWSVDGAVVSTLDQSATDDLGTRLISGAASFTIAQAGVHRLRYTCLGQNGAFSVDNDFVAVYAVFLRGARAGLAPWPDPDRPVRVSAASAFQTQHTGGSLFDTTGYAVGQAPAVKQVFMGQDNMPFDAAAGPGNWAESDVWLDAGAYVLDVQGYLGTQMGVVQLSIDGSPVGFPQAAGTVRPVNSQSAPGNGNRGGSALALGEIDLYDAASNMRAGSTLVPFDGGTGAFGAINDALTNVQVATSGYKNVRLTTTGKNSASSKYDVAMYGTFRRVG